jgi:DNA-binding transcriptional ArsR family regulator
MMPTTRDTNQPEDGRRDITPTQLFTAFSHERRQQTLAYLAQKPAAIALGDLAEYIAIKEEQPSYDWYERILTDLAHCHLPHLQEAGLIEYDAKREIVELAVRRSMVAPYLELAGYTDV